MKRDFDRIWQTAAQITQPAAEQLSAYNPVLRQLLFNRGIGTPAEAETYLNCQGPLHDPFLLTGMQAAVERIREAIHQRQRIVVYGDYDVDGVSATALLVGVLRRLGAVVEPYIPDRFEEGYGLNNTALDQLAAEAVGLVITVDCGVRSLVEAEHARELGLEMVISDHHEPKTELPVAVAVINPRQPGDLYPEKNLAGVGLAYKLAQALFQCLHGDASPADAWLDLVAVGTVADIVPLSGENRSLVKAGLALLRQGRRQGLHSLAGAAGIASMNTLCARDIGFTLGPRLNAAGRLESALDAFDLLMAEDEKQAGELALKLDDQNRERQDRTRSMQVEAEQLFAAQEETPWLIFAFKPEFDFKTAGLVGLVASRLTETYYRPSIVACLENGAIRASCRSIPEFHITQALDECADWLVRHGGHAMAAGFTVQEQNLSGFLAQMNDIARRQLAERELRPVLQADMELTLSALRPEILLDLDRMEPTGMGNPSVYFISRNLQVKRVIVMGREKQHLKLVVSDGRITYDAVAFRMGHLAPTLPERVDLLYAFERNYFNGKVTLQLMVRDLKPSQ